MRSNAFLRKPWLQKSLGQRTSPWHLRTKIRETNAAKIRETNAAKIRETNAAKTRRALQAHMFVHRIPKICVACTSIQTFSITDLFANF